MKVTSPDYQGVSPEKACEDFKARIKLYETQYEPLCLTKDNHVCFLKVVNTGKRFLVNRAEGYVESKVVYYMMNIHVTSRSIYLTRVCRFLQSYYFNIQNFLVDRLIAITNSLHYGNPMYLFPINTILVKEIVLHTLWIK